MKTVVRSALALALCTACGPAQPSASLRWGALTEQGPRVRGDSLGTIEAGGVRGTGYDIDGDGLADAIDIDGDGISDGEDINADGTITVWSRLGSGWLPSANASGPSATAPDDFNELDPSYPLLNRGADGDVHPPQEFQLIGNAPGVPLRALDQGAHRDSSSFAAAAATTILRASRARMAAPSIDPDTLWASPIDVSRSADPAVLYGPRSTPQDPFGSSWQPRFAQPRCDEPRRTTAALDGLVTTGAATLAQRPIPVSPDAQCPTTAIDEQDRSAYRIGSWQRLLGHGAALRAQVREAVAAGLPVIVGMAIPRGLRSFRETVAGTDVRAALRSTADQCIPSACDAHAMVITGYSEARHAYRLLNSWGADWGDQGSVWWDYDALEASPQLEVLQVIPMPTASGPTTVQIGSAAANYVVRDVDGFAATEGPLSRLSIRVRFDRPVFVHRLQATSGVSFSIASTAGFYMTYGDLEFFIVRDTRPRTVSLDVSIQHDSTIISERFSLVVR